MGPVLLSANSFWNIVNFRGQLVEALVERRISGPDCRARYRSGVGQGAWGGSD